MRQAHVDSGVAVQECRCQRSQTLCPPSIRVEGLRGGVPREQKMLKGHLPRVIYHQVGKERRCQGAQAVCPPSIRV